jgi:hypothetical protein
MKPKPRARTWKNFILYGKPEIAPVVAPCWYCQRPVSVTIANLGLCGKCLKKAKE